MPALDRRSYRDARTRPAPPGHPRRRRPRLQARDKLFWLLVRRLHQDWRRHLLLVRPETVLGWHRRGWRLFWRWRSGPILGRPRLNPEVRELIATIAGENLHWGSERIRGRVGGPVRHLCG